MAVQLYVVVVMHTHTHPLPAALCAYRTNYSPVALLLWQTLILTGQMVTL